MIMAHARMILFLAHLIALPTFQEAASLTESPQTDASLQLMEGRLTWLVHFIGAIIRGRLSSSSGEAQEALDGDLAACVFQLIKVTETGVHAKVRAYKVLSVLQGLVSCAFPHFGGTSDSLSPLYGRAAHASSCSCATTVSLPPSSSPSPPAQRHHQRSKQRLDLAILSFFQSFRRVYVGDQAMHSSKVRGFKAP